MLISGQVLIPQDAVTAEGELKVEATVVPLGGE